MAIPLARAHILAQARLRGLTTKQVERIWRALPAHNRENVDEWLSRVLPLMAASQRQSVALTDAFLGLALQRAPLGVPVDELSGAAVRNGTPPEEVYTRPFVSTWTALGNGVDWGQAVAQGLDRATSAAATDVQLSMRATAAFVGEADDGIYGYERVTDGAACLLCEIASTQRYHSADLQPIHSHCGCGVNPLTNPADRVINRDLYRKLKSEGKIDQLTAQRRAPRFRERAANNRQRAADVRREMASETDPTRRARLERRAADWDERARKQDIEAERAATRATQKPVTAEVVPHGELGPLLVNADHHFQALPA